MENLEKMITVRIMQEDAETIFSLMKTERDPIFAMEIIPYYALFIQSCQEYIGETFIEGTSAVKVKDIRNFIKIYGESFGKSKKRKLFLLFCKARPTPLQHVKIKCCPSLGKRMQK